MTVGCGNMHKHFRFLRPAQPLQLYFFAVPRLCLSLMGYWPEAVRRRALVNFVVLAIGVLTELHAGFAYLQRAEITLALETLCPAGTSAVTLLKMYLMLRYRHDLSRILGQLRQLLFQHGRNVHGRAEHDIKRRHAMLAARLTFWPLSTGFFTCTTYNLKPLLLALLLHLQQRDAEIVWNAPFNMTMPAFMMRGPLFPLTYMCIAYTGYVTIFMFGGCDAFYFEFCAHIGALFKLLHERMRSIFQPYEARLQLSQMECADIEEQLIWLIQKQNAIFALTHFFRSRYAVITLAHFLSAGMVIGISIFDLLTVSDNGLGALVYIGYTVAVLGQLLIYCYGGTLVAEASVELASVVGTCPWQLCQPRQRRYLLLIILRSQRALTMDVPFFSPSLSTFGGILQTSGSIIALAKSFQ